jgi:16S rRNA A1518/A1519 N6-dimethyltransferase RsmA/KsgA/DIM1 with predicted DNA glycosylase/AP lyase activity
LSFVWPPDSPWAPQWQINKELSKKVVSFSNITKKDVLYELGSGTGALLLTATEISKCKSVGIEIDPVRFFVSYIRSKFNKNSALIQIIKKDFKRVNLSSATVVYMYLIPEAMKKLTPKLKDELQHGTKIISYRYKIPLSKKENTIVLSKEDTTAKIYLYTVKKT